MWGWTGRSSSAEPRAIRAPVLADLDPLEAEAVEEVLHLPVAARPQPLRLQPLAAALARVGGDPRPGRGSTPRPSTRQLMRNVSSGHGALVAHDATPVSPESPNRSPTPSE